MLPTAPPPPSEGATARTIVRGGRERVFLGGCSYLGLAHHPAVLEAAREALGRFGVSAGAARGTSGTCVEHEALEAELAAFAGAEACALLPSAALGDLALAVARIGAGASVWTDAEAHLSILDALRAAGARVAGGTPGACDAAFVDATFPAAARRTELDPLAGLPFVGLDDAHGFGLLGARGAGVAEELDLRGDAYALVVSLSKALGCQGGAVLGSASTIAAVRRTAAYACSTAPPPATVAAARVALGIVREEPERRARCFANARRLHALVDTVAPTMRALEFPVRALALGDEGGTARLHRALGDAGLEVPLVRYPGGPAPSYLRFAVSAAHEDADLDLLEDVLGRWTR